MYVMQTETEHCTSKELKVEKIKNNYIVSFIWRHQYTHLSIIFKKKKKLSCKIEKKTNQPSNPQEISQEIRSN